MTADAAADHEGILHHSRLAWVFSSDFFVVQADSGSGSDLEEESDLKEDSDEGLEVMDFEEVVEVDQVVDAFLAQGLLHQLASTVLVLAEISRRSRWGDQAL